MPITTSGTPVQGKIEIYVDHYTNDKVWRVWNRNSWFSANTSTTSTGGDLWYDWNRSYTSSTSSSTSLWLDWNRDPQVIRLNGPITAPSRPISAPPLVRSEADWAAIRAEQERNRAERDRLNQAARDEARRLMALVLTPAQMKQYQDRQFFEVVGSEGGIYRIYHGTSGNIRRLEGNREINQLCVHPTLFNNHEHGQGYMPTEDVLVAQALAIMHDERGAVLTANVHRGERHLRAVA